MGLVVTSNARLPRTPRTKPHTPKAAVKSAINNTGKLILKDHLNHCMVEAAKSGDRKAFDDLNEAIDRFLK